VDSNTSGELVENVLALRPVLQSVSRAVGAFGEVNGDASQLAETIVRRVAMVAGGGCILELLSDDCLEIVAGYAHGSARADRQLQVYVRAAATAGPAPDDLARGGLGERSSFSARRFSICAPVLAGWDRSTKTRC
jgi:hypothetical protein